MTKKVIRKRIRYDKDGVQVSADVNAVIASNVRRRGSKTSAKSHQRVETSTRATRERR
jgi:hypothetical protein